MRMKHIPDKRINKSVHGCPHGQMIKLDTPVLSHFKMHEVNTEESRPTYLPRKKTINAIKYKPQNLGKFITVTLGLFSIYQIWKSVFAVYKYNWNTGFCNKFPHLSAKFPVVFANVLAAYFFVKAVAVPSYAAGINKSKKHWPLSTAFSIFNALVFYQLVNIASRVHNYLNNNYDYFELSYIFTALGNISYLDMIVFAVQCFACGWYSKVCMLGDKENFSFLKPWIKE